MERYDEFLFFNLPEGYCVVEGLNDEGEPYYNIKEGRSTNDEGEETFEQSAVINKVEFDGSPFAGSENNSGFSIDGKLDTFITVASKEMNVLFFTVNVYTTFVWIKKAAMYMSLRAIK